MPPENEWLYVEPRGLCNVAEGLAWVALPQYQAAGIDKVLVRVIRFKERGGRDVPIGLSICSDKTAIHVLYEDHLVEYVGASHNTVQMKNLLTQNTANHLYRLGLPAEWVTLGCLYVEDSTSITEIIERLDRYKRISSWVENNMIEAYFATLSSHDSVKSA